MIKELPGWLNFFILSTAYAVLIVFLRWLFGSVAEDWFLGIVVFTFAGAYLAKWRFYGSGWHFQ